MKRVGWAIGLVWLGTTVAGAVAEAPWKEGDIIFHTSLSSQSRAIQLATHSKWSHVGLIFKRGGQWVVLEAVQPVKWTPLNAWIARGKGGHFVLKRLRDSTVLTPASVQALGEAASQFLGKRYDPYFEWSDDKIYCSELIWKTYQRAIGIELSVPRKMKEFDFSQAAVKAKLRERYGNAIPAEEPVVSPSDIEASPLLETVAAK